MHCASVGEYEQGLPVLQALKKQFPNKPLAISFFSPSGYELLKDKAEVDLVFYLPLDSKSNAQKTLHLLNPSMAVFVKYEFWLQHLEALSARGIPTFLVSGIFRSDQIFFQFYGARFRRVLRGFRHLYVQNQESIDLLKDIEVQDCSMQSDSRFDRVLSRQKQLKSIQKLDWFLGKNKAFVAGSTWPADEELLAELIRQSSKEDRFVIVPHEIHEQQIQKLEQLLGDRPSVRYSSAERADLQQAQVLIVDQMGLLFDCYAYAHAAYVGGGFGKGIHNTLEPAVFGLPIAFGPKHEKFAEAQKLLKLGAARSIANQQELIDFYYMDQEAKRASAAAAKSYVEESSGGAELVAKSIVAILNRE